MFGKKCYGVRGDRGVRGLWYTFICFNYYRNVLSNHELNFKYSL
mgnify:CR=1 FL=1